MHRISKVTNIFGTVKFVQEGTFSEKVVVTIKIEIKCPELRLNHVLWDPSPFFLNNISKFENKTRIKALVKLLRPREASFTAYDIRTLIDT